MTSKRIAQKIEQEKERERKNGERKFASEVRRFNDWSRVPDDFVEVVEQRLGIKKDQEQISIGREQERLLAVAPKREGINPLVELETRMRNGTLAENGGSGESTKEGSFMAKMMNRYAPTKE